MNWRLIAFFVAAVLSFNAAAFAQSTASAPTAPANTAAAEPVPTSKKFACRTASQGFKGQEQRDQMQLCVAQARLDCLKQAIDQKIVGLQRRDFLKNCVEQ